MRCLIRVELKGKMESDEALYCDVRNGSKAAFELLYAKYERPLFSFLLKRLGNRQEAEEVFQEAMISIYRGPVGLMEGGAFAAWLYKVALNLSLNRNRSRRREQAAMAKLVPFEADRVLSRGGEDEYIERETEAQTLLEADQVKRSVKDLAAPLQQVYQLRSEGRSYEEMSEIVGVPVGTIKSRIHKMVSELRKEVGRWIAR